MRPARLTSAASDATAVGARLEVELLLGRGGDGLERAAGLLAPLGDLVEAILVRAPGDGPVDSGTPAVVVVAARRAARPACCRTCPSARWSARSRRSSASPSTHAALGMVGVPFAPTVHRDDDRTVMENLLGLDQQVRTAVDAIGGRPVRVGPVTLATVNGPWPAGQERPGGMPPQVDIRQPSLFTAAWTVGALAGMLVSGATSVTLYETIGWRGVMEREDGSRRAGPFPVDAGRRLPGLACAGGPGGVSWRDAPDRRRLRPASSRGAGRHVTGWLGGPRSPTSPVIASTSTCVPRADVDRDMAHPDAG